MSVHSQTCSFCKGSGQAERWETAELSDGTIIRRDDCTPEMIRLISDGAFPGVTVHWTEADCPRCDGQGSYLVEVFRGVRIF